MAVAKSGTYELFEAGGVEGGYEGLLVAVMNLCQEHWDAHRGKPLSKRDKQIGKREEHRPKARMDHCSLMEVLY